MVVRKLRGYISQTVASACSAQNGYSSAVTQVALMNTYRLMRSTMRLSELPPLQDVGFKVYSQFEEDGMLLYIFSLIGTVNKRVVEVCAGNGRECMAANLICNHGWEGLLFDGDPGNVDEGRSFYAEHPNTFMYPPRFVNAWITRESINNLIEDNDFSGEVDLLSLDMDGNDYWVLEALSIISPRVIICEIQDAVPPHLALSQPYKEDFVRGEKHSPHFCSASLLAMQKLCAKKHYRLIGMHRYGFNAFFMRNDVGSEVFPKVSVESALDNSYARRSRELHWPEIQNLPWVAV